MGCQEQCQCFQIPDYSPDKTGPPAAESGILKINKSVLVTIDLAATKSSSENG
jgi:hypothetical protein